MTPLIVIFNAEKKPVRAVYPDNVAPSFFTHWTARCGFYLKIYLTANTEKLNFVFFIGDNFFESLDKVKEKYPECLVKDIDTVSIYQ